MFFSRTMIATLLLAGTGGVWASDGDQARAAINKMAPGAVIEDFQAAPMPGWYTAVVGGSEVYVSADGAYLLNGALWAVEGRSNLTELARGKRRQQTLAELPAERLISFAASKPQYQVTVFTAIDCGYCRKLHEQVAKYNEAGISVNYLLFPRGGLDSQSYQDAVSVWCAPDRAKALSLAKSGAPIEPKICPNPIADNLSLAQKLGLTSTPTIVADDGTVMLGYVAPADLRQRLDSAM